MSSNYGFQPTLDGLNNIDTDSTTANNIIVNDITITGSGTAPTMSPGDNSTNIATTAYVDNATTGVFVDLVSTQTITGAKTFSNANTVVSGNLITNNIVSASATTDINIGTALTTGDVIIGGSSATNVALNWGGVSNSGILSFRGGSFNLASTGIFTASCGSGNDTNLFTGQGGGTLNLATLPARAGAININTGGTSTAPVNISSGTNANAPITIGSTASTTQTATHNAITTFSQIPSCAVAPTTANHLTNKNYVDTAVSSGGAGYVTLATNQTITGEKTFTDFNYIINDTSSGKTGTLLFQDDAGDGALMYYNDDDSTGTGGLRVVSTKYGFAFSSTTGAGEHCDFISQDINFRSTDKCDFTEFVIPPPAGGQLVRGSIYDNTTDRVTFTFANGQATDIGVTFNALNVTVPAGNRCNMVRVSIPFDLLAWATFGLPAGSGTVGLRFDSFSVVYLKNGSPFTPFRSESTSSAIGVTRNWAKTGTQSNISGISSYFGNLDIAFEIAINNTSTDTYQVRVNPLATITFSAFSFDGFKFVCRNATGGQTNGNGFTTTSITAFTGGTLVYGGGNPAFVDTSVTQLAQSYPVPPVTASCFMPLNNNITPPGMISQYAGSVAPEGWLLCNGGSYSITTYPNLYAVISNNYGGSLGAGTFSVPDTRGLFVSSAGSQTLNSVTYTRTLGQKQNDTIEDHKHTYSDMMWWDTDTGGGNGQTIYVANADHQVPGGDNNGSNGDGNFSNRLTKKTWPSTAVAVGTAPGQQWLEPTNVSAITATETFPANIAFNYIIKW
jgi:microcystin-dependent protein